MILKLFAAKRNNGYSGGLIIVAANNLDEAYKLYKEWAKTTEQTWIYESYEGSDGFYDVNNVYPREYWYEIRGVNAISDSPRVIDEGGYTE